MGSERIERCLTAIVPDSEDNMFLLESPDGRDFPIDKVRSVVGRLSVNVVWCGECGKKGTPKCLNSSGSWGKVVSKGESLLTMQCLTIFVRLIFVFDLLLGLFLV